MIIEIRQRNSNTSQEFDITYDRNITYIGINGKFHGLQAIRITQNGEEIISGSCKPSEIMRFIPLALTVVMYFLSVKCGLPMYLVLLPYIIYLIIPTKTHRLYINEKHSPPVTFQFEKRGIGRSLYNIRFSKTRVLECYSISRGSWNYVSVYDGKKQIALIESYLTVVDDLYTYKLYIPDEYAEYKDILALFVLYYANKNFTHRFHFSRGTRYGKAYSISLYNNKYDPQWREKHFPNENFWGPMLDGDT